MTTFNKGRTELLKKSFLELMKNVGTTIPGHFLSFDAGPQLAQIQIGVQRVSVGGDTFTPSPIIQCPVVFLGGSEYFMEHQIDPGDECMIIFSQRCIEGWKNTGGVATNPIMRFHNINDACILPGLRSQPNKISNFQNNGIRLRNKAGNQYIWLKNDGTADINVTTLNINADIIHTGDNTQTGTLTATNISATNSLLANGDEVVGHAHSGITPGSGTSDPLGG